MEVLLLLYIVAGYWATRRTIYRNRIMITTHYSWFFSRLIWGTFLGWILIPWAVINEFVLKR